MTFGHSLSIQNWGISNFFFSEQEQHFDSPDMAVARGKVTVTSEVRVGERRTALPSLSFPACTRATVPPVICNPHPHKTSERLWSQEELRKLTEVQAMG